MLKKEKYAGKNFKSKIRRNKATGCGKYEAGGRTLEDGCKATAQSGKAGRGSDPDGGYPGRCGFYNEEKGSSDLLCG